MALGDSSNDFEMIAWAGVGVAMGNARTELKTLANHVTDKSTEGGWNKAVRLFLGLPETAAA